MNIFKREIIIAFVLVLILSSLVCSAFATGVQDLNEQKQKATDEKQNANLELQNVQASLSETMIEIGELSQKITEYNEKSKKLKMQIDELLVNINSENAILEVAEEKYNKQKMMLDKRLIAMYEAGETSYLDMLLTSRNLSDFISNYFLISELARYDTELLEKLDTEKRQIQLSKESLESKKNKLVLLEEENEKNIVMASNMQILKTSYIEELTEEEKTLQEQIDAYDAEIARLQENITDLINLNVDYAGGKMLWPAPGHYIITSPFGYRIHPIYGIQKFHYGVDIAGYNFFGTELVAANDGIVVRSEYSSVLGNLIEIDHGGGIRTVYGHGSERKAEVGQTVKAGDVVLLAGSTGVSTGPHLHFEVRLNGTCVDPMSYITSSKESEEQINEEQVSEN